MRQIGIGIGLPHYRKKGNVLGGADNMTDGTTLFTFGLIDGDLAVYYTESESVRRLYKNS